MAKGSLRINLGRRIRQLRKAKRWTQQDLAERAGLDYKYLGAVERGERNITVENIEKIAVGLGSEPYDLFLSTNNQPGGITKAEVQSLLDQVDPGRLDLIWRVLRELALWSDDRT